MLRTSSAALVVGIGALTCACSKDEAAGAALAMCDAPTPPAAALTKAGPIPGGRLLPGGRALTPAGVEVVVKGFPADVRAHPTLPIAYIGNTGYAHQALQVLDLATGTVVQDIVRAEAHYGLALTGDGKRLFASGGHSKLVEVYDIGDDGKLTAAAQVQVPGYPAGLALSSDGARLWVGEFTGNGVAEIDVATLTVTGRVALPFGAYGVVEVSARGELYAAGFGADQVAVIDVATRAVAATIPVGGNPLGLAVSADGSRVFVGVTSGDTIVAIDTSSRTVAARAAVGEPSIARADGSPLPASSPSGLVLDAEAGRLYVTRGGDNAVGVFEAATLAPLGAIPVAWYPTAVARASGGRLVVTNGKGVGVGPYPNYDAPLSGKESMAGSVSIVDLAAIDLKALTAKVEANVRRPNEVFPFTCDDKAFPVPATVHPRPAADAGADVKGPKKTPIEHVVLIVRENKTYDSVLGDLDVGERDPSLVLFGEEITPNLHALARRFAHHDNFYDDSENSVQGHLWLTSSFVNDYIERTWIEDYRGHPGFDKDAALPQGRPGFGSFFTHLYNHGVPFKVYGEIVGALDYVGEQSMLSFVDTRFPGGFYNTNVPDEEKARYVAKRLVDDDQFPPFVYVLLPNDHTHGTSPGSLTPEAMISDNDYATGILIDKISHSKHWATTAIFLVEDDPQAGADHIDYHRSICVVASPWAKPNGYVSSVHSSYPSIFKTIELILGLPPMNRYDALATPLWDAFSTKSDPRPFDAVPRRIPDAMNSTTAKGADFSLGMDFRGPDKNPELGDLLWWVRKGTPRPGSRLERLIATGAPLVPERRAILDERDGDEDDGDGDADDDAYDEAARRLDAYLAKHPEVKPDFRPKWTPR